MSTPMDRPRRCRSAWREIRGCGIVLARNLQGRAFQWLLGVNAALLTGMSALTFVWITLRP